MNQKLIDMKCFTLMKAFKLMLAFGMVNIVEMLMQA